MLCILLIWPCTAWILKGTEPSTADRFAKFISKASVFRDGERSFHLSVLLYAGPREEACHCVGLLVLLSMDMNFCKSFSFLQAHWHCWHFIRRACGDPSQDRNGRCHGRAQVPGRSFRGKQKRPFVLGLSKAAGRRCWPALGSQACPGAAEAEQSERLLLAAISEVFFPSAADKLGWSRGEQGGGEGKAGRGRGSHGCVGSSAVCWEQLVALSVGVKVPVFGPEVTQAAQRSAHSARQILAKTRS